MNNDYKKNINSMKLIDVAYALILCIATTVLLSVSNEMMATINVFIVYILLILILKLEKRKLDTIGVKFSKKDYKVYIMLFIVGFLMVIVYKNKLNINGNIMLYYLSIIVNSVYIEWLYRGYIQTRLYGLKLNKTCTIVIGALLYSISFITIDYITSNINIVEYINVGSVYVLLIFSAITHLVYNHLYQKTNSIWYSVILHTYISIITRII